jgi:uncharacterized membrane protein YfcA
MMDTTYLAPPVFFIIAFVFSMLGMGGSQLYIPILFWLGMSFKAEAIPLGMLPTKPVIVIFALFTATAAVLMLSGWRPARGKLSPRGRTILGVSAGGVLGFFAGLIGRGGGSFVVPLLYIAGLEARVAAATSALVVTCSGTSSFLSHIATAAQPQWAVWLLCAAAVFAGAGWVLLAVATLLIVKDVALG